MTMCRHIPQSLRLPTALPISVGLVFLRTTFLDWCLAESEHWRLNLAIIEQFWPSFSLAFFQQRYATGDGHLSCLCFPQY